MKSKSLLLSLVLSSCLVLVAGCGETKYSITTSVNESEYGYVKGAGSYAMGAPVNLKIYPNEGCQIDHIYFDNNNDKEADVTKDDTNLSNKGYIEASFTVKDTSIGNYEIVFNCEKNEVNSNNFVPKYKVYYVINETSNGYTINNPFGLANTDNYGRGYELISSGTKIAANISYVPLSQYSNYYFEWYTDSKLQEQYKFDYLSKTITKDIVLYGKKLVLTKEKELNNAIKVFNSKTSGMIITDSANNVAEIYKLGETGKTQIGVKEASDTTHYKWAYKESTEGVYYYEYDNDKYMKLTIQTGSGTNANKIYGLDQIDNIYDFVRIKDIVNIKDDDVKTATTCGTYSSTSVVGKCYEVGDYTFKLENGTIKEFQYKGKTYTIDYDGLKKENLTIASSTDMYLVKLNVGKNKDSDITEDELNELKGKIAEVNKFTSSIKVSSGGILSTKINKALENVELLKKYDYKWTTTNGGNCTTTPFDIDNPSINSNTSICLYLTSSSSEFKNAINNTKDFNIEAELDAFDETIIKKYYNVENVNSKIDGVDTITAELISQLAKYISKEDPEMPLFKKRDNGSYDIYDQDNNKIMSIVLTGGTNTKIKEITYIYEGVSYKYTFKGVLENAIENMTNFAYKNNADNSLSSLYSDIKNIDDYECDFILSNLVKIQEGNLTYTKDSDGSYIAIDEVNNVKITIELTSNKDRIFKVTLEGSENDRTYTFVDKLAYGIIKSENFTISSEIKVYGGTVSKEYTLPSIPSTKDNVGIDDVTNSLFEYLNSLKNTGGSYTVSNDDEKGIYKVYDVVDQEVILVLEIQLNDEGTNISTIKFTSGVTYLYTFTYNTSVE